MAAAWPSVCFWAPALRIMEYIQVPKLSEQLPGAGPGAPCPSSSNSNELFTRLSRQCARVAPHDTRASFHSHPVRTGFTASSTTSCLALPRTKLRKGLLLNLEFSISARLADQQPAKICLSLLCQYWDGRHVPLHLPFSWVLKTQIKTLVLVWPTL